MAHVAVHVDSKASFPCRLQAMLDEGDATLMHWSKDGRTILLYDTDVSAVVARMGVRKKATVMQHMKNYAFKRTVCVDDARKQICYAFRHATMHRGLHLPDFLSRDVEGNRELWGKLRRKASSQPEPGKRQRYAQAQRPTLRAFIQHELNAVLSITDDAFKTELGHDLHSSQEDALLQLCS